MNLTGAALGQDQIHPSPSAARQAQEFGRPVVITDPAEYNESNIPDLPIKLSKPMTALPVPGSSVTVAGLLSAYSPRPFMFIMTEAAVQSRQNQALLGEKSCRRRRLSFGNRKRALVAPFPVARPHHAGMIPNNTPSRLLAGH